MVKIKIAAQWRSSGNPVVTAITVSGIPDFFVFLAVAEHLRQSAIRMLIRRSTSRYRWDGRPTNRRLKWSICRSASPSIRSGPAGMRMYMSRAVSLAVQ